MQQQTSTFKNKAVLISNFSKSIKQMPFPFTIYNTSKHLCQSGLAADYWQSSSILSITWMLRGASLVIVRIMYY